MNGKKVEEVVNKLDDRHMMWCHKHGKYAYLKQNRICPECERIRKASLCVECEKHKATVDFCEGALQFSHFGASKICQCCYFKKVEATYLEVKKNYEKLILENKTTCV